MALDFTIVDTFTSTPFQGNPAAVIILKEAMLDPILQNIAREFNLSETAFITPFPENNSTESITFGLRWFSPQTEVPICGHATLAASRVLFDSTLVPEDAEVICFQTRVSGVLSVKRVGNELQMEFPAGETTAVEGPLLARSKQVLRLSAGEQEIQVKWVGAGVGPVYDSYLVVEVDTPDLASLRFDPKPFEMLAPYRILCLTTIGGATVDFLSRTFAPLVGVPEDPVTGSAHSILGPFWSSRLGKEGQTLEAQQVSERGGRVKVLNDKQRGICTVSGDTKVVAKGTLYF